MSEYVWPAVADDDSPRCPSPGGHDLPSPTPSSPVASRRVARAGLPFEAVLAWTVWVINAVLIAVLLYALMQLGHLP